jgi:hypothetical protein
MHKSFFPLFIVSLIGVLATSSAQHAAGLLQYSGLAAGITPLAIYHAILQKKRLLSPTEVDSIYYFGFLVTILTLVSTAISIGVSEGAIELRWVLLQFGLGLVATGYALFARLQLLAQSTTTAETDIVETTERLAKSIERVAGEFDKAGYNVAAFVELAERRLLELEQRTQSKFTTAEAKFEQRLNEAATAFNEILAKSASQSLDRSAAVIEQATTRFSEAISSVMDEVGRVQIEAEAISFEKASERIVEFAGEMERSVVSISGNVSEAARASAEAISELTAASRKTMKLATDISARLENLNRLEVLVAAVASAEESIGGMARTAAEADTSLALLASRANLAEQGVREGVINPLSSGGLAAAVAAAERTIGASADAGTRLVAMIEGLSAPVAERVPELMARLEAAVVSAASLDAGAASLSVSMAEFETSLRKSTETIVGATGSAMAAASLSAEAPAVVERLISSASALVIEANRLQAMLEKSRTGLEGAIASASTALGGVQSKLAPLEDLASSARLASQQIRATAAATAKVTPFAQSPIAAALASSAHQPLAANRNASLANQQAGVRDENLS